MSESSQVVQLLVYVVDNGSPDEPERELRAACADHIVVQSGSDLGYAGGKNVGIQLANLKSLDYYLKRYRALALPIRWSIILSAVLYWLPGVVKTATGARALEARIRGTG